MKINLAGFNIDTMLMDKSQINTPETIATAYARISRCNRDIDKLRVEAIRDISEARELCKKIVFDYGHSSIAEHAVFNFDLINISRLAVEYIESSRLASYTEKSQRYQKLDNDYYKNDGDKDFDIKYNEYCDRQFHRYKRLLDLGASAEDARYVLPLSAYTQLGMTLNARSLGHMIYKLRSSQLAECIEIADTLFNIVNELSPALIRLDTGNKPDLSLFNFGISKHYDSYMASNLHDNVSLINYQLENSLLEPFDYLVYFMHNVLKDGFNEFTILPREFELFDFTFYVNLSAAAFGQLKRHRMATIIPLCYNILFDNYFDTLCLEQMYDYFKIPINGYSEDIYLQELYNDAIYDCYEHYFSYYNSKFPNNNLLYGLINASTRKCIVKMNLRELFHFTRLRCDKHAQWEIRQIANEMIANITHHIKMKLDSNLGVVKKDNIFALLGGKHEFDELKNGFLGRK